MHLRIFSIIVISLLSLSTYAWNTDYDYDYGSTFVSPYNHFDYVDQRHHCNCIKLKSCSPIIAKLSARHPSKASYHQTIMKEIRKKACGFIGSDPMICCNKVYDKTTESPWIWDKSNNDASHLKPTFASEYDRRHQFRTYRPDTSSAKRHNFFDFEDPHTFRNCPRIFSPQFQMPSHIGHAKSFHGVHSKPNNFPFDNENAIDGSDLATTHRPIPSQSLKPIQFPTDDTIQPIDGMNPQECGLSINTRIIGGDPASPGQFPWMARLAYRNRTSQLIAYRCSGTVIGRKYVLTVAHCITNLVDDLELVYVTLGNGCIRSLCPVTNDYEIESAIYHPAYDTPKYANDIALLKLRVVDTAAFPSPLCLPIDQYAEVNRDLSGNVIVAGWGASISGTENNASPVLQQITLAIVNNTQCANFYARFSANTREPIIIGEAQICAQGTTNRDACQGDSGGPLMRIHRSGRFTLIGLVSFGPRQCGIPNFPGVYTRVSSYASWIAQNMRL